MTKTLHDGQCGGRSGETAAGERPRHCMTGSVMVGQERQQQEKDQDTA